MDSLRIDTRVVIRNKTIKVSKGKKKNNDQQQSVPTPLVKTTVLLLNGMTIVNKLYTNLSKIKALKSFNHYLK